MDRVPYMDQSGLYAMEDAIMDLENQGIRVVFTGVHGQPKVMLERIKIIPGLVEDEDVFEDFESCAKWLEGYLRDNIEAIDEANKASK